MDLIYKNLHPALQLQVKRDHITDLVQLYEVTPGVDTLVMQRNYKPSPSVDDSLMPEFSGEAAKPPKSNKPGVLAVTPDQPPDLVK